MRRLVQLQPTADRNGLRGQGRCPGPELWGRLPSSYLLHPNGLSTGKVVDIDVGGARSRPPPAFALAQRPQPLTEPACHDCAAIRPTSHPRLAFSAPPFPTPHSLCLSHARRAGGVESARVAMGLACALVAPLVATSTVAADGAANELVGPSAKGSLSGRSSSPCPHVRRR